MVTTALLAIPLGVGAAIYLEEFADSNTWYNRLIEVNLQNLAAVPSIIYGMLAAAVMGLMGFTFKGASSGPSSSRTSRPPAGRTTPATTTRP